MKYIINCVDPFDDERVYDTCETEEEVISSANSWIRSHEEDMDIYDDVYEIEREIDSYCAAIDFWESNGFEVIDY